VSLDDLRRQLAEYDPSAPRCHRTYEVHRNYAPDDMTPDDPEWDNYTVTHHVPCCRPSGHEGECRNSRRVMGWPGLRTLTDLIDEVERSRVEIQSIVAWLGKPCGMSGHDDRWCPACEFRKDIANDILDGKYRQ